MFYESIVACRLLSRFYLGGPTSVRGFGMYSIGPQSEGKTNGAWYDWWSLGVSRMLMCCICALWVSGDYLGGEAYWAGGVHLYTPLPFRPGKGGFGDLFRMHFFLNAGNLCNLNYGGWKDDRLSFCFAQIMKLFQVFCVRLLSQQWAPSD